MSPRALDPAVRARIIDAAIRILGTEGRPALTARRLARETATSTTSVYTYFGSMDDVHRHVRRHALGQLASALDALASTGDPVADLARASVTHVDHGYRNPAMYRVMFVDQPPDDTDDPGDDIFRRFAALIDRCIQHRRFRPDGDRDAAMWAGEVWTLGHGVVMLASTGLLPAEQARELHRDMIFRICAGFGDDRDRARRSIDAALLTMKGATG